MKKIFLLVTIFCVALSVSGQVNYPLNEYTELPNPKQTNITLWAAAPSIAVQWGDVDTRYAKEAPYAPSTQKTVETLTAWRGEAVAAQLVVSSRTQLENLNYSVSNLVKSDDNTQFIGGDALFSGFVRYVMTDELNKDGRGACGHRNPADYDYSLAADGIDHITTSMSVSPLTSRPIWIRVSVPQTASKGLYTGTVTVKNGTEVLGVLTLNVRVVDEVLPLPSDWKFHLDLWQNPYSVARYYQVAPWSEAHLEALRKEHKLYAEAGGKVITASIIHDPWNSQTEDVYETMIKWTKKTDGSWAFDFTIFDTWVELMMGIGVDKQINCYSMIPWKLAFRYYDEATQEYKDAQTAPGDTLYEEMWVSMLRSFATHLREKGWFDKTYISMDERPMDSMLKALAVIRKADPLLKVSLAGSLHADLIDELDDYCVALGMKYTEDMLRRRKQAGKITTFYTSCEEARPNTFTFSPPAESEWFAWYAAKANLDGYLRWALNCWVQQPLLDSRFRSWAAGDTYLIYPNARTSIRFERMKSGIQMYEKIRILKERFTAANDTKSLSIIQNTLVGFDESTLLTVPAADVIRNASQIINGLVYPYDMLGGVISQAKWTKMNVQSGTEPGFYHLDSISLFQATIDAAELIHQNQNLTDNEYVAAAEKLTSEIDDFKKKINMPKVSTDKMTYWYSLSTPLRENGGKNFATFVGLSQSLYGDLYTKDNFKQNWKVVQNADGTYNLVNRFGVGYISPNSAYNTALKTLNGTPTANGWLFKPVYSNNLFAITSGAVQMNQTGSGQNFQLYNWGGGNDLSDTGCQFQFRTEETTTKVRHQKLRFRIWTENGYLKADDDISKLNVYSLSGQKLNKFSRLPKGFVIVATPLGNEKLAVIN